MLCQFFILQHSILFTVPSVIVMWNLFNYFLGNLPFYLLGDDFIRRSLDSFRNRVAGMMVFPKNLPILPNWYICDLIVFPSVNGKR